MYLDLSCPLELIEYELARDDLSKVRAYLSLNNLSDRRIERIEGDVHWLDTKENRRITAPFIADQLRTQSQRPFKIQLSCAEVPGANELELTFHRLGFADGGADWIGDAARLVRIEPPLAPRGAELNQLLAAAGTDARNFPLKTSDYWVCVCGRPNALEHGHCARCKRRRAEVLAGFTRAKVLSGEAPAVHDAVPEAEIPAFLAGTQHTDERDVAMHVLSGLKAQYRLQRNTLLRRSVFLVAMVLLAVAVAHAMRWLGEKREIARDMRPPVKVEETAR